MSILQRLMFALPYTVIGLATAVIIYALAPGWFTPPTRASRVPVAPSTAAALHVSFADAVAAAAPAVVNIHTARFVDSQPSPLLNDPFFKRFFGETLPAPAERMQTSLGSGVILDSSGLVVTNHHVVSGADEIQVLLQDGRAGRAEIVGVDEESDLAVLKVGLPNLPTIRFDPRNRLEVGDVALAIGNPFGVGQTVTMGIVSATGRTRLGLNTFEDFIQTDAAINPGNSGGALINSAGELIGINTAIFSRSGGSQGIGFAIPARLVAEVVSQIVANGHVSRGWLGVEVQRLYPANAAQLGLEGRRGVLIATVFPKGPAAVAGLEAGDLITEVDGAPVSDPHDAVNAISRTVPGHEVQLKVVRQGETRSMQAVVGERPQPRRSGR